MRLRNQSSAASLALSAAFSASAIGSASAMAATPQTATQSVSYLGHQFTVPASWPVIDLGRAPSTCVRLWLATGNGASITSKDNPFLLGVADNPELVTKADGSFQAAWKGGDGYLWLASGTGTTITAKGNPWLLGVA